MDSVFQTPFKMVGIAGSQLVSLDAFG